MINFSAQLVGVAAKHKTITSQITLQKMEQNKSLTFGIFFTSKLVGVIGFNKIDWQNKQANIDYWLAANYQGRGIITTACQILLNVGFKKPSSA